MSDFLNYLINGALTGLLYALMAMGFVVIYRASKVTGPYTPGPFNPILTQRDLPADRPLPITTIAPERRSGRAPATGCGHGSRLPKGLAGSSADSATTDSSRGTRSDSSP